MSNTWTSALDLPRIDLDDDQLMRTSGAQAILRLADWVATGLPAERTPELMWASILARSMARGNDPSDGALRRLLIASEVRLGLPITREELALLTGTTMQRVQAWVATRLDPNEHLSAAEVTSMLIDIGRMPSPSSPKPALRLV